MKKDFSKEDKLIGKEVFIKNGCWNEGHWGRIRSFDGVYFHIGGGSLGTSDNPGDFVYLREEFVIPRIKK